MKKQLISLFLTLSITLGLIPCVNGTDYNIEISAKSAVLMEAESRTAYFEKSARQRLPMASTTKIMTALIVLENSTLSHTFTVDDKAIGIEGSSAYLQKGDTLTIEAALYALLLQSANDIAVALAIEIGGSTEKFVEMMNRKAQELSLQNTQFKNPSGLSEEGHYTSAYDLAYLACVCLENEVFCKIVSTKAATVKISEADRTFVNHNKLLSMYNGAFGIKTGFTKESGRCLVGAAEQDGVKLVTVTLSASNDWNDHKKMFDYGFNCLKSYTLYEKEAFIISLPVAGSDQSVLTAPSGRKMVTMEKGKRIRVIIEADPIITAPVNAGTTVGYAIFYCDDKELWRTPLTAITKVT